MLPSRWEYKRLYIKDDTSASDRVVSGATFLFFGKANSEELQWHDDSIADLGREGWELVTAVPLTGGCVKEAASINWGVSYTLGVMLWFKRPLSSALS